MKKLFILFISLICCTAILCACSKKANQDEPLPLDKNIVGTWTYADADGKVHSDMGGWIFNEDKTGIDTVFDLTFTYEANDGMLQIKYDDTTLGTIETSYKYKINDLLLTMRRNASDAESFTYKKDVSIKQ